MNRIQSVPPAARSRPAAPASAVFQATFSQSTEEAPYSLFVPLHYEPNYAYPLVVWLHGPGDDEGQLKRIMPHVSMRNYAAIAPRGTRHATPDPQKGYTWSLEAEEVHQAEQRVFDAIREARQRLHIDRQRVFLAGFDTGGMLAFRLAMSFPDRFAGVLSLNGRFPQGRPIFGRLAEARRVPLFLAVGRDSTSYPLTEACTDLRLFHSAGMMVALRIYPCGHEVTVNMLSDMDRWMMELVTRSKQPQLGRQPEEAR